MDDEQQKANVARAFEEAVADTLAIKCKRAIVQLNVKRLVIAGGVGANKRLRATLKEMVKKENAELYFPRIEFCTDNGAMIAYEGCLRLNAAPDQSLAVEVRARWPIDELNQLGSSV